MREPATTIDTIGACASTLCAAHCFLAPILTGLSMAGLETLAHPACETGLRLATTALAAMALAQVARHGRARRPSLLFVAGLLAIWLGHLAIEGGEVWTNLAGGLAITAAHLMSRRLRRRCPSC